MNDYLIRSYVDLVLLEGSDKVCQSDSDNHTNGGNKRNGHKKVLKWQELEMQWNHLSNILADSLDSNDEDYSPPCVCSKCMEILEKSCSLSIAAIDTDINAFETLLTDFDEKNKNIPGPDFEANSALKNSCIDAILKLEGACSILNDEIVCLDQVLQDQLINNNRIYENEQIICRNLNDLDHDLNVFKDAVSDYNWKLTAALDTEIKLSRQYKSLHNSLFHIVIDNLDIPSSRSYLPVYINGLRLAHRPKGNLKSRELNLAWTEACLFLVACEGEFIFCSTWILKITYN